MLPPEREPPIITRPRTMPASSGSEFRAVAMLVSGPSVRRVTSPGYLRTTCRMNSAAGWATALIFGSGKTAQPIFTMRIGSRYQPTHQRTLGARSHRNVRTSCNLHHTERVGKRQFQWDVSGDRRDGLDLELRRPHGEQKGERVVHSRIRVDNRAP